MRMLQSSGAVLIWVHPSGLRRWRRSPCSWGG